MTAFLIILAVLFVLTVMILSLSAEFTVIFDNGWSTKIRVLFIEKDIELTKLLSFLVSPEKAGEEAAEEAKKKKKDKKKDKKKVLGDKEETAGSETSVSGEAQSVSDDTAAEPEIEISSTEKDDTGEEEKEPPKKPNAIKKLYDKEGIVGVLQLVSNLLNTANTAVTTLIKGLHIYSLYVKMIIGGGDAATIAEKFGGICSWYYPVKGVITTQMKVDNYDELIIPDYIAPRSEYEFQLIGSLSVGLLVKMLLKAGKVFLVNFIKNK